MDPECVLIYILLLTLPRNIFFLVLTFNVGGYIYF